MLIREDDVFDHLPVPLTAEQVRWLARLAHATGDDPAAIVSSLIEHIRVDDLLAHGEDATEGPHACEDGTRRRH